MKKWCVLFCVLLVLAGSVQADEWDTILSGVVAYDHEFEANGNNYELIAPAAELGDDSENQLFIRKNGQGFIVDYADCTTGTDYKYCYDNITYDSSLVSVDDNHNIQPAIHVTLEERLPETTLSGTKTSDTTVFAINEIGSFTIELSMSDTKPYKNIVITEEIPEGFEIINFTNFERTGQFLIAKTELNNDTKSWSGSYTIKAIAYGEYKTQTKITYDTGTYFDLSLASPKETLVVLDPYTFEVTMNEQVNKDKDAVWSLAITNNENETLTIDELTVTLPELPVVRATNLVQKTPTQYTYSGTIPAQKSNSFVVTMQGAFPGIYNINYEAHVNYSDTLHTHTDTTSFEVVSSRFDCFFTTTKAHPEVGDTIEVSGKIHNHDSKTYENIVGILRTDEHEEEKTIEKILFGDEQLIGTVSHTFTQEEAFTVDVIVTYEDKDNTQHNCTTTHTFTSQEAAIVEEIEEESPTEETTNSVEEEKEKKEEMNTTAQVNETIPPLDEDKETKEKEAPTVTTIEPDVQEDKEAQGFFGKLFLLIKNLF